MGVNWLDGLTGYSSEETVEDTIPTRSMRVLHMD